jgi:hypothetical protein
MDFKLIGKNAGLEILEVFDIADYDLQMNKLHEKLKKYSNYEFKSNERLLFLHFDTEFIVSNFYLTLYNLHQILYRTFIPNFACIILSQQNLAQKLIDLNDLVTKDIPITFIPFEGHLNYYKPSKEKISINIDNIKKQYIFLSNTPRFHRKLMFNWLSKNNLLDFGIVSHKKDLIQIEDNDPINQNVDNSIQFIYSNPKFRVNDSWICEDNYLKSIAVITLENFKNFEESNVKLTDLNNNLTQQAFCYVSSETVFNYPCPYTSEKSFKAFSAMRPMISFGAAGTLKKLHNFGFQTWNRWWSEDYDEIKNPTERFIAVASLVKEISNIPLYQCKIMLNDMKDVLIHNQKLYIDNFLSNQKSSLIECLKSNH